MHAGAEYQPCNSVELVGSITTITGETNGTEHQVGNRAATHQ